VKNREGAVAALFTTEDAEFTESNQKGSLCELCDLCGE